MQFANAMRKEGQTTFTENGALALNTTGDARLDLFGTIGSLRKAEENRIITLFAEAYKQNPLFATKIVFYARDIREGLGERNTFRVLLRYMAKYHQNALRPNLDLIGVFGRYDDLYCLVGTDLEEEMWKCMKQQFEEDLKNLAEGKAISLLAKWIKTADSKSVETRKLGILTAQKLGYPVYHFKRMVRSMRKHIGVVEGLISTGQWDKVSYSAVPSRAMMIYQKSFLRHDTKRFQAFINRALEGKEHINASTLYPYDIVEKILYKHEDSQILEAQWRQLPNYVEEGTNAIVMADVSGSMYGRPLATAIGLAIYFAERNKGAYQDMFMTFSAIPEIVMLRGETLRQKISYINQANWDMNTDLASAFAQVLNIAIKNNVSKSEMVKSIIVVSDMEIDRTGNNDWSFYNEMKRRFEEKGYDIPNIIFWNVESRHDVFHADKNRMGVQLCSGQSVTTFQQLVHCIGLSPIEMMEQVINSDRYACITVDA